MHTTIPVSAVDDRTRYIAEQYLKTTPHIDDVSVDIAEEAVTIEHDGEYSDEQLRSECRTAGLCLDDHADNTVSLSLFEQVSTIASL
jgi:hypothetical protein